MKKQFQKIVRDIAVGGLEPTLLKDNFDALIDLYDQVHDKSEEFETKYNELLQVHEETKGAHDKLKEKYHNEIVLGKGDEEKTPEVKKETKVIGKEEAIAELAKLSNEERDEEENE